MVLITFYTLESHINLNILLILLHYYVLTV